MIKTFIDWEQAAEDNIFVFVWDEDERPHNPTGLWLRRYNNFSKATQFDVMSSNKVTGWRYADFVYESDRIKYTKTIKEPTYRPCKTWDEFKKFWGKTAKTKGGDYYRMINNCKINNASSFTGLQTWFYEYELLEEIDGSKVIGVEE